MQKIQADVVSLAAREQLAAMRALQPPLAPQTAAGQLALARLLAWDGAMRADAPEPLLWHAWLRRLRLRIFADDLGDLADEMVAANERTLATLNVLRGATHARDWCDDRTTERIETCSDMAATALDEAVTELAQQSGRDVSGLRWGDAHQVRNEHRPLSNVALLRPWVELAGAVPGDTFTINVGQLSLAKDAPYATRHAASLRAVYDLAPGGGGAWNFPTGQDGHPLSDHYGDLFAAWRRVELTPMQWQSQAQESHLGLLLQLVPKRATSPP